MWLAVDAGGGAAGGVRAWPVGGEGSAGAAISAPDLPAVLARLDARPEFAVLDGAEEAGALTVPCAIADLAEAVLRRLGGVDCVILPRLKQDGAALGGVARLAGALRRMRAERPAAKAGHVCVVGRGVEWAHEADGRITGLRRFAAGERLAALLGQQPVKNAGGSDEDDDVAFERGLSLAGDGGDPSPAIAAVLKEAAAGERRGGALGAMLAGVLVGADAALGLKMGRLGGPIALVGPADPRLGLMAQRYAVALGRFGVAVRCLDGVESFIGGCRALAMG